MLFNHKNALTCLDFKPLSYKLFNQITQEMLSKQSLELVLCTLLFVRSKFKYISFWLYNFEFDKLDVL